jgi:signal transduction histidine kinase
MTHEFRTPLNAIIGYADLMMMEVVGEIPTQYRELLGYIKSNVQSHLELVNGVLDMSAIEAGRLERYVRPTDVRAEITGAVDDLLSLAVQKNLSLNTLIDVSMPDGDMPTDEAKLRQIVTNLVGNALKFTESGGIQVIVGSAAPADWYVKVKDTGRGIPKDAQAYIFETFRQVESSDSAGHKGTGLGLSITLGLVQLLGGRINVESEVGKGSTFTVTFPRDLPLSEPSTVKLDKPHRAKVV